MTDIRELEGKAKKTRQIVLDMCAGAGEGRVASAFSSIELMVALFAGGILRINPGLLDSEDRDRFVMSKSPGVVGLYPVLSDQGYFPEDELDKFCRLDGRFGPYGDNIPGVEAVWGSLGHGIGTGAGLALAAKLDGKDYMTVVLVGDGECYEGSIWEGAMFAAHNELDNLVAIVDRNEMCTIDFTENCLRLEPLEDKWRAFGWDTVSINGHSFEEILGAFEGFRERKTGKPLMIIANTVKGKGVSMLEGDPMCHIIIPTKEQLEKAREELRR